MKVRICARPRGPLVVHLDGVDCELRDAEDRPIDVAGRDKLLLCRCGASSSRPLCDGSHNRIGFEAPTATGEDGATDP